MHLTSEYFNKIVRAVSHLYPTKPKVESILIKTTIPLESIRLTESGIDMWDSAISWTDKNGKHLSLINKIVEEYPEEEELSEIRQAIINKSAFIVDVPVNQFIKPNLLPHTAKVFLIYDQKDFDAHVEDLVMQLHPLEFPPSIIQIRDMYDFPGGANINDERLKSLGSADIVLLLLTKRFFGNTKNDCLPLIFYCL